MSKGLKAGFIILLAVSGILACTTSKSRRDVPVVNGVVHTVQQDETIYAIAKTYEVSSQLLVRRNNLHEGDTLQPGTRLFVPGAEEIRLVETEVADSVIREERDGLFHRVGRGETLLAIANAYSLSLEELQRVNNLPDPSKIYVNQELWIPRALEVKDVEITPVRVVSAEPVKTAKDNDPRVINEVKPVPAQETKKPPETTKTDKPDNTNNTPSQTTAAPVQPTPTPVDFPRKVKEYGPIRFQWPLKGSFKFLRGFSTSVQNPNPGIDLGAGIGSEVCAAADGEVLMVGGVTDTLGMRLGNHIILYHGDRNNKEVYSLYAHNSQNIVKIGEKVKRGQAIAKVGRSGRPSAAEGGVLHFEVREHLDSIDPLKVLPPLN